MTKHLEVKTIEYKGISVKVEIDYDIGKASLVDDHNQYGKYQPKEWVFAGRTLDYMNPWLNILDAMKFAVEQCKKDLEYDLAEKSKFKDDGIAHFIKVKAKRKK